MPANNEIVIYRYDGSKYKSNIEENVQLGFVENSGLRIVKVGFYDKQPIAQPANADQAAVSGTAGASYTATEQAMLNDVVKLANALRSALVSLGLIKGSA